jgi:hypothetical protein
MPSWKNLKIVPNEHPILRIISLAVLLECLWGGDTRKGWVNRIRYKGCNYCYLPIQFSSFSFFFPSVGLFWSEWGVT